MVYTSEKTKILGENIWMRRESSCTTRGELASQLGVGKDTLSKWENGHMPPNKENLSKLTKIFNCSKHDLHRQCNIPKLSLIEEKVIEKKEEPVMSGEDMVKAATEVFENAYIEPKIVEEPNVNVVEPLEEPKEVKPEVKASISDRLGAIYNTLFNALAELDELKADIGKIEKVTTMLKEIQGL